MFFLFLSPTRSLVADVQQKEENLKDMRNKLAAIVEKGEKDIGIVEVKIGQVEEIKMTGEDMTVQGGAEVRTGKAEEEEITDTLTD